MDITISMSDLTIDLIKFTAYSCTFIIIYHYHYIFLLIMPLVFACQVDCYSCWYEAKHSEQPPLAGFVSGCEASIHHELDGNQPVFGMRRKLMPGKIILIAKYLFLALDKRFPNPWEFK